MDLKLAGREMSHPSRKRSSSCVNDSYTFTTNILCESLSSLSRGQPTIKFQEQRRDAEKKKIEEYRKKTILRLDKKG